MDDRNFELFPEIDLSNRLEPGAGRIRPIGRCRLPQVVSRKRPSIVVALAELRGFIERQHDALVDESRRLGRCQRDERESLPMVLRGDTAGPATEPAPPYRMTDLPAVEPRQRPLRWTA